MCVYICMCVGVYLCVFVCLCASEYVCVHMCACMCDTLCVSVYFIRALIFDVCLLIEITMDR